MAVESCGRVLGGDAGEMALGLAALRAQPVDQEDMDPGPAYAERVTTLSGRREATGPGTFLGKAQRTLRFMPAAGRGWILDRSDLEDSLPIDVSVKNVWTTNRNIVLCSGSPHNYMRMVEHIVALKYLGLDDVRIQMDSGDPPLFDRGSMDLVEAIDQAEVVETDQPARYVTVSEPVSLQGPHGSLLVFRPAERGERRLTLDCGIDFPTAIGQQRIRIEVNPRTVRYGAAARTNCSQSMMLYCRTVGKLFADTRSLGYSMQNILIAGREGYVNKPGFMQGDKSLEAVWHRAIMDLVAAVALIDKGRFVGHIDSYKAGHALDVNMIKKLYKHDLLVDA
jgi:UDP-3-O-[3-hydroxymyristoyl] N-acetylglucosamine deacetylase